MTDHPKPAPAPSSSIGGENQCANPVPFVDTPVLAAKRRAFDDPTQANLDALIAAVRLESPAPASSPSALVERLREAIAQITPGEWHYDETNMEVQALLTADPNGPFRIIVELDGVDGWVPNGRFIAQAPSLMREAATALAAAESRQRELELLLSKAAQRINCAGPVHHRIDVLRQQLTEHGQKAEQRADAAEALSAQQAERIKELEQERDALAHDLKNDVQEHFDLKALSAQQAERIKELEGALCKIAECKTCEDEPDKCRMDGGPSCGVHGESWATDMARKALTRKD